MRRLPLLIPLVLMALLLSSCATREKTVQQKKSTADITTMAVVEDDNFRTLLLQQGLVQPYKGQRKGILRRAKKNNMVEATPLGRATKLLNCHHKDIKSLQGIELFPNLELLVCSENPIKQLDLSRNPKLKQLSAVETPLKKLDISHNTELKIRQLSFNNLRNIDLSHNPKLEEFLCIFSPRITALDFSHNPHLHSVYLRQTNVPVVDFRRNKAIRSLFALETPLQYVVVSPEHDLGEIEASVEDVVRVLVLDTTDEIPHITVDFSENDTAEYELIQFQSDKNRKQLVMTHAKAQAMGFDEPAMKEAEYRPSFSINTVTDKLEKGGIVHSETNLTQFLCMWSVFISGITQEMKDREISWDTSYRAHAVVYFAEDGYADYFIYNFLGETKPTPEMQEQFEDAVRSYIANNPINFYADRPFSQCGGFMVPIPDNAILYGTAE